MSDWAGRTALVTGGRRGLGRAYAEELTRLGCRVVVTSRHPETLASSMQGLAWDMDDPNADASLDAALRDAGLEVDLLVHAAHAFPPHALIFATKPSDLAASLGRNVVAPFALCRRLGRGMARRGFGRILLVGSFAASVGGAGQSVYVIEKSALAGMMRAFSVELGRRGVLVNMVEPGIVDTENVREGVRPEVAAAFARRTVVGRLASADDVVAASIGLLDPRQGFVTGQILRVLGGADGGGAWDGGDGDA